MTDQILDMIKKRRSIRSYKKKKLPKRTVDKLLEAAKYAPTAKNLQQLEYKVITNRDLIRKASKRIIAIFKKKNPSMKLSARASISIFYEAPLLIIITGPEDNRWTYSDAALATQNIMLEAASLGLGTCFIGMARFIEEDKKLMDELHIPKNQTIAAAVIAGYPDETPAEKERKMNAEFFK